MRLRKCRRNIGVWVLVSLPGWLFCLGYSWRARGGDGISRFTLFDDAMISMSYGRTFAKTGELVWFPGADRVQGFTNPLWTLVMALVHLIIPSGEAAVLAMQVIGFALLALTSLLVGHLLEILEVNIRLARLCSGCTYFLFPLMFWTIEGMEVGLLGLLVLSCLYWASRDTSGRIRPIARLRYLSGWGLLALLGVSTRIDFIVPALAVGLVVVLDARRVTGRSSKSDLALLLAPVLSALIVVVCQKAYFGDWLPNTYHLKIDGASITTRVRRGFLAIAAFIPVAVLVSDQVWRSKQARLLTSRQIRTLSCGIAACASVAFYSIWVGGDAWEGTLIMNRFLATALPSALVCLAIALHTQRADRFSVQDLGRSLRVVIPVTLTVALLGGAKVFLSGVVFAPSHSLFLGLVLFSFFALRPIIERRQSDLSDRNRMGPSVLVVGTFMSLVSLAPVAKWVISPDAYAFHRRGDLNASELGVFLSRTTVASTTLGVVLAGNTVYWSQRAAVDLLGKSDRYIARSKPVEPFWPGHNKYDFEHSVIDLDPDIVIQGGLIFREADLLGAGYVKRCIVEPTVAWKTLWIRSGYDGIDESSIALCPSG